MVPFIRDVSTLTRCSRDLESDGTHSGWYPFPYGQPAGTREGASRSVLGPNAPKASSPGARPPAAERYARFLSGCRSGLRSAFFRHRTSDRMEMGRLGCRESQTTLR